MASTLHPLEKGEVEIRKDKLSWASHAGKFRLSCPLSSSPSSHALRKHLSMPPLSFSKISVTCPSSFTAMASNLHPLGKGDVESVKEKLSCESAVARNSVLFFSFWWLIGWMSSLLFPIATCPTHFVNVAITFSDHFEYIFFFTYRYGFQLTSAGKKG